jgi:hypothetical protein
MGPFFAAFRGGGHLVRSSPAVHPSSLVHPFPQLSTNGAAKKSESAFSSRIHERPISGQAANSSLAKG